MAPPWISPSAPSATASTTSGIGRQTKTDGARSATSFGLLAGLAPLATSGAIASSRTS